MQRGELEKATSINLGSSVGGFAPPSGQYRNYDSSVAGASTTAGGNNTSSHHHVYARSQTMEPRSSAHTQLQSS